MSKFTDELKAADPDGDLQAHFAARLAGTLERRKATVADVLRALIGNVAGVVKAATNDPNEWRDAARVLAEELKLQLQAPLSRTLDMRTPRLIVPVRKAN